MDMYYEHKPDNVTNNESTVLMWDVPIIMDRSTPANGPDIILHNKQENICLLIDI